MNSLSCCLQVKPVRIVQNFGLTMGFGTYENSNENSNEPDGVFDSLEFSLTGFHASQKAGQREFWIRIDLFSR